MISPRNLALPAAGRAGAAAFAQNPGPSPWPRPYTPKLRPGRKHAASERGGVEAGAVSAGPDISGAAARGRENGGLL